MSDIGFERLRRMIPDRHALLHAYTTMRRIREFEERVNAEFVAGHVPGFVHLYSGEEAIAVGICIHLDLGDYIGSTHRGHGHSLAKGCDSKRMMLGSSARPRVYALARAAPCTLRTWSAECWAPTPLWAAVRPWSLARH